ncbi:MAG: DegV family protein [Lachnospiraceae bacterium]|nr:DegV family protein [Lachnospiraceae bacterium]
MSSNYVIIPDANCDLPKELREKLNIPDIVRGIVYFPDGHSELQDLEWQNISAHDFYHSMRNKNVIYKSATPPAGEIEEVYEKYLSQGMDILSMSISTGLSSTQNDCQVVADELLKKYPERKIICLDTLRFVGGYALLVKMAAEKQAAGATMEEVADYINTERHRVHQTGTMDDLFFLVKSGRISNFKAFFGSMVGLKLIAEINQVGMSEVIAKFKGARDAMTANIEYIKQTIQNPEEQTIIISNSDRHELADLFAEQIRKEIKPKDVMILEVGQGSGVNIGPGLCAAYYLGAPTSENLEKEKAVMAEIEKQIKGK